MGAYTDNLFKKRTKPSRQANRNVERLKSCAIMLENGEFIYGFKSHYELRDASGWENPTKTKRGTRDGFWTTEERFVTREEGRRIAQWAGQIPSPFGRELLSSDIDWNA